MDKKSNPVRGRPASKAGTATAALGRPASNGIKLIIGLGNPDKKYANTYHNVGFLLVDHLVKNQRNFQFPISNFQLRKSGVYMNESGKFVAKELRRNGLKPSELLVLQDDSDIAIGEYKFSFGRGAAGHHGAESVIAVLGTKNFWRLRIGVRKKETRAKAGSFVLKQIKPGDRELLEACFKNASYELERLLRN